MGVFKKKERERSCELLQHAPTVSQLADGTLLGTEAAEISTTFGGFTHEVLALAARRASSVDGLCVFWGERLFNGTRPAPKQATAPFDFLLMGR